MADQAATHGFTVAFAISSGTFAAGAIMGALLFPTKKRLAELRESAAVSAPVRSEVTPEAVAVEA